MPPLGVRGTVTLLARVSPSGKLRVDVRGTFWGVVVRATNPGAVWPVTVRLPVTATAAAGTFWVVSRGTCPVTWNDAATLAVSADPRPIPLRESTSRLG